METQQELQAFFLKAAAQTYAGKGKKRFIDSLPAAKVYRFEKDGLLYIDTYFTNGEFSGGQTIIYRRETWSVYRPLWIMQYNGWCRYDAKDTLAFLKAALAEAYLNGEFYGGRGPAEYVQNKYEAEDQDKLLVYRNHPNPYHVDFDYFEGRERIFRHPDHTTDLFWHRYQGMMLQTEPGGRHGGIQR